MKYIASLLLSFATLSISAQEVFNTKEGSIKLFPIQHATMVMNWQNQYIYVDPYGGEEAFSKFPTPDFILITDIHGDHLNMSTLQSIDTKNTTFIVPEAVALKITEIPAKEIIILKNSDSIAFPQYKLKVNAIPMYNLPELAESRHIKGRGNGYVLTMADKKLYLSGDTEAIPEMRALKEIDIALVCMNLPYTMDVQQAAEGVLDFKPSIVIPYHYRGKEGLSDINLFKKLVNNEDENIKVQLLDWYPEK